jgi:hypothetical protein
VLKAQIGSLQAISVLQLSTQAPSYICDAPTVAAAQAGLPNNVLAVIQPVGTNAPPPNPPPTGPIRFLTGCVFLPAPDCAASFSIGL